jgi:2-dehydro-3-deoxyphosphogluconate aldolase / (4S)-4-hydroxy-2-oxoglutarate aldolase
MVTGPELLARLRRERILAILRGRDRAAMTAAGLALIEEGISCLEVSLTGADALGTVEDLACVAPEHAVIGVGTVVSPADVSRARDAGGQFVVTPGLTDSFDEARSTGLPVIGGALTPTEIIEASRRCTAVKLFPASFAGPAYLTAVRAPLPDVDIIPVGGIDAAAAAAYLAAGALAVGVGAPLIGDAADGGNIGDLRRRARAFIAAASAQRRPASTG